MIVCGCVVLSYFFYAYNKNQKVEHLQQSSYAEKQQKDPQDLVNKYLQQAQKDLAIQNADATLRLKKLDQEDPQGLVKKPTEVNPEEVPVEQQIWRDADVQHLNKTIDERADLEIEKQKQKQQQKDMYKQEYIRQFKENARRNGYDITVDESTLEVIESKPIRVPQGQKKDYDSNREPEEY